ncbi:MAG: ArnT family glycosyltransferase [Nitrospirales bacterium]
MRLHNNDFLQSFWQTGKGHWLVLGALGLLAFFSNLPISLFGVTEGLYAAVTETMVGTGEYVRLTLHGQPYFNKPPMFFWFQALSTQLFGWSEAALRLPSALFSLGTVVVTYWLGRTLFSATAGFWAALVVLTSYASLWFGQMAIIDPILTFCMTLGILGFVRAYFQEGTPWWYVVGFVALALGAMVKNLHALVMPVLLFLALLWLCRDSRPIKTAPFWLGLLVFMGLIGSYYAYLGQEFIQHYVLKENLQRMTKLAGDTQGSALEAYFGKRPIVWYFFVMWFDFFPWSVLIPTGLTVLWRQQPLNEYPREAFVLFWVLGYFLAFSLFPEKHERYLMPMVPAVAMLIGYVYYRVFDTHNFEIWTSPLFKYMLGLLSLVFIVAVFLAPYLLQKKWNLLTNVFPLVYQLPMVCGIGALLYAVLKERGTTALKMVGVLAVGLMIGVVQFIVPGINAMASPKFIMTEVQSFLKDPRDPIQTFQHWNWRNDEDLYYWQHVHKRADIVGEGLDDQAALNALQERVETLGARVFLMTEAQYQNIVRPASGISSTLVREFQRPKKKILLVLIESKA